MVAALLSGTKVLLTDNDLKSQLNDRGFGNIDGPALALSLIEAAYLAEKGTLEVVDKKKKLEKDDLVKVGEKLEGMFYDRYIVYRDLRERGMLVRTGLKFGTDFRMYDRGAKLGKAHSKYLVHVVAEEFVCSFPEMARALRMAKTVNKDMIYAIVDGESDVTYYLVDRMRF